MSRSGHRQASRKAREPISIITIEVQECGNTFGVSPCTATGEPCDQAARTCRDFCNFTCVNRSYCHSTRQTKQVTPCVPDICRGPEYAPGRVELCEGLPSTGNVSFTLQDSPDECDFADPYRAQRDSITGDRLSKFLERHAVEGRRVIVEEGYCDAPYPDAFIRSEYFLDAPSDPTGEQCKVTFRAKDPMTLLANFGTRFPEQPTEQPTVLVNVGIASSRLFTSRELPTDADAVCIGGEAMHVQFVQDGRVGPTDAREFAILGRAQAGSTLSEHAEGSRITIAKRWPACTHVADVILDALIAAGLPVDDQSCECGPFTRCLIDVSSFEQIKNDCPALFIPETWICTPGPINALYEELELFFLIPYYDQCDQKIRLRHFRPPTDSELAAMPCFDERFMVDGELTVQSLRDRRISRVTLASFPQDATAGLDDLETVAVYQGASGIGDACTNPEWMPPRERDIQSRFFGAKNQFLAARAVNRLGFIRSETPKQIQFRVDARDLPDDITETSFIRVKHTKLQNARGADSEIIFMVNQLAFANGCWSIMAESTGFLSTQRWALEGEECDNGLVEMTFNGCGAVNTDCAREW